MQNKSGFRSVQVSGQGQDADYREVIHVGGKCFTIVIHADSSYHNQSHAHISVWNGTQWAEVHRLQALAFQVYPSAYKPGGKVEAHEFKPMRDELLAAALAITGVDPAVEVNELGEQLRAITDIPFPGSTNGQRWDEGFKAGWDRGLDEAFKRTQALRKKLGVL